MAAQNSVPATARSARAQVGATDCFLNVGMGVETTISELVERLCALTSSGLQPQYLPQQQMFVTNRLGSTEPAEELIGFRAGVALDEGFASIVEWRRRDKLANVQTG